MHGEQEDQDRQFAIKSLIIEPYMDFTNNASEAYITRASSAIQTKRFTIPRRNLIAFGAITAVSLLWWLIRIRWLVYSGIVTPNSSMYPEIDFGSKCVHNKPRVSGSVDRTVMEGIDQVLYPLSNATSTEIIKDLRGVRIHLGSVRKSVHDLPHIIFTTKHDEVEDLMAGVKYS